MNYQRISGPALRLMGVAYAGPFQALSTHIPGCWRTMLAYCAQLSPLIRPSEFFAVGQEFTHAGITTYVEMIMMKVLNFDNVPVGMIALELPATERLLVPHHGPMTIVQDTYRRAYAALPQMGLTLDPRFYRIERYDNRYIPTRDARVREDNEFDILLPVRRIQETGADQ